MPKEIEKFGELLQSGSLTLETTGTSLYQSTAKKVDLTINNLIERRGLFYLYKIDPQGEDKSAIQFCYGINSKYCFELKKNKTRSAWVVSRVVDVTPNFDDTKQGFFLASFSFHSAVDKDISGLTSVRMVHGSVPVKELFNLPGFQLNSVSLVEPDQKVLRASFDCEVTDPENKKPCRSNCVLEFNLGMHCLPTKLHQWYKNGSKEVTHDWQREWVKTDDYGYTATYAVDTKTASDSVTKYLIKIRTNKKISTRDLPESDFTLSAFGFPEPPGVEWKKPFPYYLVAIGVGIVCLAAFAFFRVRARRAASS